MIPLPTVPTDNLYKFGFVSGLLLILASLILPSFIEQQRLEMSYQLRKESAERNRSLILALATISSNDPEMKDRARRIEILKGMGANVENVAEQEVELLKNEIKSRTAIVDKQLVYLQWAMPVGIAMMAGCSYYWYVRSQRLQDQILKSQAEEAKAKAPNNLPKPA